MTTRNVSITAPKYTSSYLYRLFSLLRSRMQRVAAGVKYAYSHLAAEEHR